MHPPLISIITPTYNSAATLPETINSVLKQSFTDWEWILADDASGDRSRSIIENLANTNSKVSGVYMERRGFPTTSREAAFRNAQGRFVAFLDADDLWTPEKLERQIAFMLERKAPFSYTAYRRINEDGSQMGSVIQIPESLTYESYLKNTAIACSTVMIDRSLTGDFPMPYATHQDFAIWLGILKRGHIAYGLPEALMHYRVRKGSVSSNKLRSAQNVWNVYRGVEKLSVPYAIYCMAHYGCHATLKRLRF